MFKFIWGFIKFYFAYMTLGVLAVVIIYASADVLSITLYDTSYLAPFFTAPHTVTDEYAAETVNFLMKTAIDSIPFDALLDDILGLGLDIDGNIFSIFINAMQNEESLRQLSLTFADYGTAFLRDLAMSSLAGIVFFAVINLKDRIFGKGDIAVFFAFVLSSLFWMLASYTFGRCLTVSLETLVKPEMHTQLYLILIVASLGIDACVNAFFKKCRAWRMILLAVVKVAGSLLKAVAAWSIANYLTNTVLFLFLPEIIGCIIFFIGVAIIEHRIANWAEKRLSE